MTCAKPARAGQQVRFRLCRAGSPLKMPEGRNLREVQKLKSRVCSWESWKMAGPKRGRRYVHSARSRNCRDARPEIELGRSMM